MGATASLFVFLVFALTWSTPRTAFASPTLEGRWKQSALREEFTVQHWLNAECGPPPRSSSSGGGEFVDVRVEGDELSFIGGGRVYRTNQCYDPMPTLARETHSRDPSGKSWRTRCSTSPADPRKAILNTLVVATSDARIDLVETGRYEVTLEGGRCMADVKRTRSFTRVEESPAKATATEPAPKSTTAEVESKQPSCTAKGPPARLEVRPSKKLLRTGETFAFRALVLDESGCETRTVTTWRVAHDGAGKGVSVDSTGRVTVRSDAVEGNVEIVVTAAGRDARVVIEVVSPARYDDLLAQSGLNAAGENDEVASVTIASQTIGAGEGRVEDRSRERRMTFLAIVGSILLVLLIVTIFLLKRSRKAKVLVQEAERRHEERVQEVLERRRRQEAEHAAQLRAHEASVAAASATAGAPPSRARNERGDRVCTTCGREPSPGAAFCPYDGTPLAPSSSTVPGSGGICPACNKGYGPDVTVCPEHKEELVPYPLHASMSQRPAVVRKGKICPTCGERFDGSADFCGKDGTVLVLLN